MCLLSDWLITCWWRVCLASLWRGMEARVSTWRWARSTMVPPVACVGTSTTLLVMTSLLFVVRPAWLGTYPFSQHPLTSIIISIHSTLILTNYSSGGTWRDQSWRLGENWGFGIWMAGRGQVFPQMTSNMNCGSLVVWAESCPVDRGQAQRMRVNKWKGSGYEAAMDTQF